MYSEITFVRRALKMALSFFTPSTLDPSEMTV